MRKPIARYEEADSSLLEERNSSDDRYFRTSNLNTFLKENVAINSIRTRLSLLLFEHVKQELRKLRQNLEDALLETRCELKLEGRPNALQNGPVLGDNR